MAASAAALLEHPLRLAILREASEPRSATAIAARLGERRYVATARRYVLAPEILGALAARPDRIDDALSASYLLALATQVQSDVARVTTQAARAEFERGLEPAVDRLAARFAPPQPE